MCTEIDCLDTAQDIVDNQDGDTVAQILTDYGDSVVIYEGDSLWAVDDIGFNEPEIVTFIENLLEDVDPQIREQIIDQYA